MTNSAPTLKSAPNPEGIDGAALSAIFRRHGHDWTISDVEVKRVGTGQLGDTFRFGLTHSGKMDGAPASVIGKFAAQNETSRTTAADWSLYEREVQFYRDLAPRTKIATPKCFAAQMAEDGSFYLFLEDMSPAVTGDQIQGISSASASQAVREAAKLHAAFWGQDDDPRLRLFETGPLAQPFYGPSVFRQVWPPFRKRYAASLDAHHLTVCDSLFENFERFSQPLRHPRCITHNDFRPDNMLFGPDNRPLTVVDWQSAALGYNAVDVAYLIGGGFTPENRRDVEQSLLAAYLDELQLQGIADYSMEMLQQDYRHFSFAGLNVAVGAAMLVKRTERGDRMFLTMLDRHVSHVLDTGALRILTET